ncbi:MAG TPA: phospholipase D-like domain-containing protein [Kofleriaceae bacterium]|nr:phospholipase D-like domain-containing protein [Kofleriaceae bacterium]
MATGCAADDPDVEDGEDDRFSDSGDGKADGGLEDGTPEARGVLALVNDRTVTVDELDHAAGLSARVARNIIAHREGAGGSFDTLAELDGVPYVGPAALQQLLAYARETGRVVPAPRVEVVFSPQPAATTHTKKIAEWIRASRYSIDIAMYSYSDSEIAAALADARARNVQVRFLFDTASEDRKLDAAGRPGSKSGKIEAAGIDVRWVNKILHHKFAIIDGPRDDGGRAQSARLVTGSGNWSYGGASLYDENTVFFDGAGELAVAYQREFDLLWEHAADFHSGPGATTFPFVASTADLDATGLDDADPDADALFTSANFTVQDGATSFRLDRTRTRVSDQLVAAIRGARTSIHVASGHLRLRAVAEALVAARQANPALDIRVYLDQQEYISASGHTAQLADLAACRQNATTPSQRWNCESNDFLFGKQIGDAGITVRYKTYAYRWDYNYAVQMHHKFLVIDGNQLFTGSYNLSMNAEQATFENLVHLRGATYAPVVAAFEREFERLWNTGRNPDRLPGLRSTVGSATNIPLVFDSMALSWQEVTDLRTLVRASCSVVDSAEYRDNPAAHRTCPR